MTGVAGYVRLSQEEVAEKGSSFEQKLELRRAILMTIARHKCIELTEDSIVTEVRSGATLNERPGLLSILERCRRRELHTVVAFDIDRLTRDVADLKVIFNALFKGEVLLVTQRDSYRFDRHFDVTLLQILAVLGEKERRQFNYRRIAANEQRTRQGELSAGYAPYGYRWDKQLRAFRVAVDEYALVEEIFRRFWSEGAYSICKDFNARSIPPPSAHKRSVEYTAHEWLPGTLSSIVRNPFYAGRFAKRHESDREGNVIDLPQSKWIVNEDPIPMVDSIGCPTPMVHPVTWEQWQELQYRTKQRRSGAPTKGVLTGMLYCAHGSPMRQSDDVYTCGCRLKGNAHRAWCIQRRTVEGLVWALIKERLADVARLPKRSLRTKRVAKPEHSLARMQIDRAEMSRSIEERESTMQDLITRSSFYLSLPGFGIEKHSETLRAIAADLEKMRKSEAELSARIASGAARVDAEALRNVLSRPAVLERIEEQPFEFRKELAHLLLERIDLEPAAPGKVRTPAIRVTVFALADILAVVHRLEIINPLCGRITTRRPA